jgi:hypothetical protein
MPFCETCGEEIGYLPFKCKYCGGVFCKKHRLPENHDCTFELKHTPVVPIPRRGLSRSMRSGSQRSSTRTPREIKKYLKRQEKWVKDSQSGERNPFFSSIQYFGTKLLILLIISITILGIIFNLYGIGEYVFLSFNSLFYKFTFHTLISSLFLDTINPFDPLFFITVFFTVIMLIFTYLISRVIEITRGRKFLFKMIFFCGFISLMFYFIIRISLLGVYPLFNNSIDGVGLLWSSIFGLMTYTLFPAMNREITAIMTIFPIRMRAKYFLLIIILLRLVPALFYGFSVIPYSFIYFLIYLPELGGILGSYIIFKFNLFSD